VLRADARHGDGAPAVVGASTRGGGAQRQPLVTEAGVAPRAGWANPLRTDEGRVGLRAFHAGTGATAQSGPLEAPPGDSTPSTVSAELADGALDEGGPAGARSAAAQGARPEPARENPLRTLPDATADAQPLRPGPAPGPADPPDDAPARPPADAASTARADHAALGTVELFRLLHAATAADADAALAELGERGFEGSHLELGKRLTDPDPAVRRRWAEALPSLRGVNARPWLVALCRDADREVRRTAITLIATSGDPRLMEHVAQAALSDEDAEIRAVAERILTRRAESLGP
jgi:hypothetical protein